MTSRTSGGLTVRCFRKDRPPDGRCPAHIARLISVALRVSAVSWARTGVRPLRAVALLGLRVGRVQQRHPTLGPQQLDLVQVLTYPCSFLRGDPPAMGQASLHLAPASGLATPSPAPAAPPARDWGWTLRLLAGHRIHQDGVHIATGGQLVKPVNRQ